MIQVELFDGTILEFPEGTDPSVMDRVARAETLSRQGDGGTTDQSAEPAEPEEISALERLRRSPLGQNIYGYGEVDTPGERFGELIRGGTAAISRGIAEAPALPVNIAQLGLMLGEKAVGMEGPSAASRALAALPDTGEMLASIPYIGPETQYVAPGTAGEYASTMGEFMGGAGAMGKEVLTNMLRFGVIPGAASETAGQLTEGTALEPYARTGTALAAGMLAAPKITGVGSRIERTQPEQAAQARGLMAEGVTPTVGQIADNRLLMALEGVQSPTGQQLDDLTAAVMRTAGSDAPRATTGALRSAQNKITSGMNDVLSGLDVPMSAYGNRVGAVTDDFFSATRRDDLPPRLNDIADGLLDAATQPGGGSLSATQLRQWRTALGRLTTSADEGTRDAAHALREVIDDATEATLSAAGRTDDIATLADLRNQYRNFIAIADVATRGGRDAARGLISPERLHTALTRVHTRQGVATGRTNDLGEISENARAIFSSLPTTSAGGVRDIVQPMIPLGTVGAGYAIGKEAAGLPGGLAGAAAGLTVVPGAQAIMRSGGVQGLLGNIRGLPRQMAPAMPGILSTTSIGGQR